MHYHLKAPQFGQKYRKARRCTRQPVSSSQQASIATYQPSLLKTNCSVPKALFSSAGTFTYSLGERHVPVFSTSKHGSFSARQEPALYAIRRCTPFKHATEHRGRQSASRESNPLGYPTKGLKASPVERHNIGLEDLATKLSGNQRLRADAFVSPCQRDRVHLNHQGSLQTSYSTTPTSKCCTSCCEASQHASQDCRRGSFHLV